MAISGSSPRPILDGAPSSRRRRGVIREEDGAAAATLRSPRDRAAGRSPVSRPRALITGITGQDGAYLAELLLEKGYEVHGMVRPSSTQPFERLEQLRDHLVLHTGDLLDQGSLADVLRASRPAEIYNLAAMSFVHASWNEPVLTAEFTGVSVTRLLEAMREVCAEARFYQASSSEMFGNVRTAPQNELTPFYPRTPYGAAKTYGHLITANYRETYGLYCCSGILFNHESPKRGLEFVTRKVTHGAAAIKLGQARELHLGNLDAERDWGYAGDYVKAMWLMLQQPEPEDFVIGTGVLHSVRRLVDVAFAHVGLDPSEFVRVGDSLKRPTEVEQLVADASKARRVLGWEPEMAFEELIHTMVDADLALLERGVPQQRAD
jgi:GDPmannose 4,6-dehydratase